MPKQTYTINGFHGGTNSNADPRDIKEEESPDIRASVGNLGMLRTLGGFDTGYTSNNSTSAITHKHGLFVMGSDTQIDNSAADETLIFHYDFGTKIDVNDSDGWHTDEITTAGSAKPTYFSADGILRVGDVNLGGLTRWYGYINRTVFASLGCAEAINDWVDTNAYPATPSAGNCLISTPYKADDTTGPNSVLSEYIGALGSGLVDMNALNLRVGVAGATSVKTDGTAINAANLTLAPSDPSNNKYDYKNYTGGSAGVYDNEVDVYPLVLDNNVIIGGKHNQGIVNGATNEAYADGVSNLSFTINEIKSIIVGVYFWGDEDADGGGFDYVDFVTIKLGTDSSNYREWQIPSEEMSTGWNIIVCEQGGHTSSKGAPPKYGDDHDYFSIKVTQIDTSTNAGNDVPKFYISGPAIINNIGSIGFTEGTYSFGYTWLYDDEKQESMVFKLQDTDVSDGQANEINKVTIAGAPLLLSFDVYMTPGGTYGLNKRIIGSRMYYKKSDDDNHYLVGELNFVDKGFKFFPEAETYDYSFVDVTSTTTNLADAVVIKSITPETANVVDSWKSLNGFYQKVDTLEAAFKTGTVQGRRAYVGNVKQDSVTYPDRMLKSMVNRFDTFPNKDSIVDVAVRDGENIIKLEAYADRILQFKEKTLYILNVAQGSEFLEDVHKYKGISYEYHSVLTDSGVAFFNEYGAFLYNGNDVVNLLEKDGRVVISEDTWNAFITAGGIVKSSVGYAPKKHQIIFASNNANLYIFNLKLGSWTYSDDTVEYNNTDARQITNFGVNKDNEMFYIGGTTSTIYKYDHTPTSSHDFTYITRDIDFGDPSVRKKVYKVYITYQTGTLELPNVVCTFDTNGGTAYDKAFADGTNYLTYGTSSTFKSLAPAVGWQTAIIKPNTSSQANNIYSFALKFNIGSVRSNTAQGASDSTHITLDSGASSEDDYYNGMHIKTWSGTGLGQTTLVTDYVQSTKVATVSPQWSPNPDSSTKFVVGLVPDSFQINDISIVYRIKGIK